jgi:alpha-beta hydrolase superfamily lysophospholipase
MPSTTGDARTRDGLRLLVRHWAAAGTSPRAAVLIVHGLGEHSGRWEHVGDHLAKAGFDAFSWDLRGFGASDGPRAWLDRWSHFDDDVEDRLTAVRAAVGPGIPVVLYGHSLGGLIALGYCESERPQPDLLVLSAPGIEDDLAAWKHRVAPALARLAPKLRLPNGLNGPMLSRDTERHERDARDPLNQRSSTTQLGALGFAAQARVSAAADRLRVPTLLIHGLDDPVVPARATEPLAALPGVTRREYPGIRHELHNEPEGHEIIGDVIAWIEGRLAARAGA